jgi:hypothetical protein
MILSVITQLRLAGARLKCTARPGKPAASVGCRLTRHRDFARVVALADQPAKSPEGGHGLPYKVAAAPRHRAMK